MSKRIGYQMQSLLDYIENNPGCNSLEARRAAVNYGRGWSNRFSDAVLNRLRVNGLVIAKQGKGNKLALYTKDNVNQFNGA